jgi:hypothetical protein
VVKLLPDNWVPAQAIGQAVASECEMTVAFRTR